MKLERGNTKKIGSSFDLPDVSVGVMAFMQPLKIEIVTKEQIDGYTEKTKRCIHTHGVRQPFNSQQLQFKPEGQRMWRWHKIHLLSNVKVKINDVLEICKVGYEIQLKTDYTEYGYVEYDAIEVYVSEE